MRLRDAPGILSTAFTLLIAGAWLFPVYWAVTTSLKTEMQTLANPPTWFPTKVTLDAYAYVLANSSLLRWYFNSILTTTIITALVLALSIPCAYALSQLRFRGRNALFWVFLAAFMVPFEALLVPLFMFMNSLNQVNTYAGIILPQLVVVITIVIFKQFFDQVPGELRDAAVIDGANEFRILRSIYLPTSLGIIWALGIVTFIAAWNNFFWPFIVTTSTDMMTIPVGITQVQDAYGIAFARTMAVAILAALPVVAVYLLFQKRITEGIMLTSGLK